MMLRQTGNKPNRNENETEQQRFVRELDIQLTTAAKNHDFQTTENLYLYLKNSNQASAMTYSRMIIASAKCKKFHWMCFAYDDAVRADAINAVITSSMMTGANSFRRFDLIEKAYRYAVDNNKADGVVFCKMMQYAFYFQKPEWIKTAFENAKSAKMDDVNVHAFYEEFSKRNSALKTMFFSQNPVIDSTAENPTEKEVAQEEFSLFSKMPF